MLRKKLINNYYNRIIRLRFIRYEKKRRILKSIIQNQKVKPFIRAYAIYSLLKLKNKTYITRQYSVCFESGKIKSQINKFNRSRQITKQFGLSNKLPSIGVKSW